MTQPNLTLETEPGVDLDALEAEYGLHCQIPILQDANATIGLEGMAVLEWGGCLPEAVLRAVCGPRHWVGVVPEAGAAFAASESALAPDGPISADALDLDAAENVYAMVRRPEGDLPESLRGRFDRVVSIGNLEHELLPGQALTQMHAALKPGGRAYLLFSPVWSAPNGHHLPEITDAAGQTFDRGNNPIPPWAHLLMTPPILEAFLRGKTDAPTAARMVHHVYQGPHINRLFLEDYLDYIEISPFELEASAAIEPVEIPDTLRNALLEQYPGRENFEAHGLVLVLRKPAPGEREETHDGVGEAAAIDPVPPVQIPDDLKLMLSAPEPVVSAGTPDLGRDPIPPAAPGISLVETPSQAAAEDESIIGPLLEGPAPTLFCMLNHRGHYRETLLHPGDLFAGPDCEDRPDDAGAPSLKTEAGIYDLSAAVERLPRERQPRAIVVKADSTCRNFPAGLDRFSVPKLLVCGNSQMMNQPIQNLMAYAAREDFHYLATDNNRHHLHFYSYLFGPENLFWLPSMNINPAILEPRETRRPGVTFVGQTGPFHPYRTYLLDRLVEDGLPVTIQQLPQQLASQSYNEHVLSLNVSLNGDFNLRVMEVLAAGGCLLTDRLSPQSGLDLLFEEGVHYIGFDGYDELAEKIRYYLDHPDQALAIARAGHQVFLEEHHPDCKRELLSRLLRTGDLDPRYRASLDPRCEHSKPESMADLEARVTLYEYVQELHRLSDSLVVELVGAVDPAIGSDLSDLPRSRISWNQAPDPENLRAFFERCAVADRIGIDSVAVGRPDLRIFGPDATADVSASGGEAPGRMVVLDRDGGIGGGSSASRLQDAGYARTGGNDHFSVYELPDVG